MPRPHAKHSFRDSAFAAAGRPAWFGDMAHMAADALGLLAGLKQEAQSGFKLHAGRAARNLDLASKSEIENLRAMLIKARNEQEKINARLEALERAVLQAVGSAPRKKRPARAKK